MSRATVLVAVARPVTDTRAVDLAGTHLPATHLTVIGGAAARRASAATPRTRAPHPAPPTEDR